ncbi:MAG: hypothetical protein ACLFQK_04055 [Fibrobacterota bacterium]
MTAPDLLRKIFFLSVLLVVTAGGVYGARITVLRAEFLLDNNDFTTGNGRFYRGQWGVPVYPFDYPVHDSSYFSAHMEFVKNYYDKVSSGRMSIDYRIVDTVVSLDREMAYYRPLKEPEESNDEYGERLNRKIMEFCSDVVNAYEDTGFVFDLSDTSWFLIFHAGVSALTDGGELGELGADSPNDFVDSYISPLDFRRYSSYAGSETIAGRTGIPVNSGAGVIDKIMISSETASQDSLFWGINGILVNQTARAAGLPNLFDTDDGVTAVGNFCLMDFSGYFSSFRGYVPPYPSAWCREYLGWVEPVEAVPGKDSVYTVTSVQRDSTGSMGSVLKVRISDNEYFLIENRIRTHNSIDTLEIRTYEGAVSKMTFDPDKQADFFESKEGTKNAGIVISSSSYDLGLPASGLLVWHINEKVVSAGIASDEVNADKDNRGVALKEADGSKAIGYEYESLLGSYYDYGSGSDVYPHYNLTTEDSVFIFGPYTRPSTESSNGAPSHIKISFEPSSGALKENTESFLGDSIVNYRSAEFKVKITWGRSQGRWPAFSDSLVSELGPVLFGPADTSVVSVFSESGKVYGYGSDGSLYFVDSSASGNSITSAASSGRYLFYGCSTGVIFRTEFSGGLLQTDTAAVPGGRINKIMTGNFLDGSAGMEVVSLSDSGYISVFTVSKDTSLQSNSGEDLLRVSCPGSAAPVTAAGLEQGDGALKTVILLSDGNVCLFDPAEAGFKNIGNVSISDPVDIITGDFDRDRSDKEICILSGKNIYMFRADGSSAGGKWPVTLDSRSPNGALAAGDIDGDGYADILTGSGKMLYAFNSRGYYLENWPVERFIADGSFSAPIIADMNGDGYQDVICGGKAGDLLVYGGDGNEITFRKGQKAYSDFPIPGGAPVLTSPIYAQADSDYEYEIFFNTSAGNIHAANLPGTGSAVPLWPSYGRSSARAAFLPDSLVYSFEAVDEKDITDLYNYPNPVKATSTYIRYHLGSGASSVSMTVFDGAGSEIFSKKGLEAESGWNEYHLSLKDVQPGVYMCRIDASFGGTGKHRFCKIAVIR